MHTPQSQFSEHPVKGSTSKELASLALMFNTFGKNTKHLQGQNIFSDA